METTTPQAELILQSVLMLGQRLAVLERTVTDIHNVVTSTMVQKEWYTTTELAEAIGKSQYTVQERWCNDRRIECEKDTETGKWRIPGSEFRRLVAGGGLLPKNRKA